MNRKLMKKLNLKKRVGHDVLNCSKCNDLVDYTISINGDVQCSYCGDIKGNISTDN